MTGAWRWHVYGSSVFFAVIVKACCVFLSPDFESPWIEIKRTSSHTVVHGFKETPLLVDVEVKPIDGLNKDFIFKAAGHQIGDGGNMGDHSSVIYIYNDEVIRVSGPTSNNGYCIMIDEDYWNGPVNTSQKTTTCMFRARAWKKSTFPAPDLVVTDVPIKAGIDDDNVTNFEFKTSFHPSFIIVRIKFPNTTVDYPDYYADSMGATHATYRLSGEGYVVYGYGNDFIRVLASTYRPYLYKGGNGFAFDVQVSEASLEIYAWKNMQPDQKKDFSTSPPNDEVVNERSETFTTVNSYIRSMYRDSGGAGTDPYIYSVGTGTSVTYDTRNRTSYQYHDPANCTYGGLVYAYSEAGTIRFWVPKYDPNLYGAIGCVDGLASNRHWQASSEGQIYYEASVLRQNECKTGYCKHAADCSYIGSSVTCVCLSGWTGSDCSIDVDECASSPCLNSGICHNLEGRYRCDCNNLMYRGINCEIAIYDSYVETEKVVPVSSVPDLDNSENQLEQESSLNTLYIPGDTRFDDTTYSVIKKRYECSKVMMSIHTQNNDLASKSVTLALYRLPGPTYENDIPICTVDWGDGNIQDSVAFNKDPTEINHTYDVYGIYRIKMKCEGEENITCPESKSTCVNNSNFLGGFHRSFQTPVTFFSTENVVISAHIDFSDEECGQAEYHWRIVGIDNQNIKAFTEFEQPMGLVLTIKSGILPPGEYVVSFTLRFSGSAQHWSDDSIAIKIVLPELKVQLSGSNFEDVSRTSGYYFNGYLFKADTSYDPAERQPWVAGQTLLTTWTFAILTDLQNLTNLQTYMANFPNSAPISGLQYYNVVQRGGYKLRIERTSYENNTYGIAIFRLTRGSRSSIAYKVIRMLDGIQDISIGCLNSCYLGRENIFKYDEVQLYVNPARHDAAYVWDVFVWNPLTEMFEDTNGDVKFQTASRDSKFIAPFGSLQQGKTYKIRVSASISSTYSQAEIIRTVNYIPYNGVCVTDKSEVLSSEEMVGINCSGWLGNDFRRTLDPTVDVNPLLRYTIFQETSGAMIPEEFSSFSVLKQMWVYLKAGDPSTGYQTTLSIKVTDVFRDSVLISIPIVSNPPFNVIDIDKGIEHAETIRNYSGTVVDRLTYLDGYVSMEAALFSVSAAASVIYLIQLPEWVPPVPRVMNQDGFVLDLNANGPNTDISNFEDLMTEVYNDTTDVTTLAIQDMYGALLFYLQTVVENEILDPNSTRTSDSNFILLCTNAVTNLGNSFNYLNNDTQEVYLNLSGIFGAKTLDFDSVESGDEEESATFKRAATGINMLTNSIVMISVPDYMKQYRSIESPTASRHEIANMLAIVGDSIDIENTTLSPLERAYIYRQQQQLLQNNLEQSKEAALNASKQAEENVNKILEAWMACGIGCGDTHSGSSTQILKKNNTDVFSKTVTTTTTGGFQLTSLSSDVGSSNEAVDISAMELKKNVYMYDDDGMSSSVSSNVLRIDAKSKDKQIISSQMMFEQGVSSPIPVRIAPNVDTEDASEFMYHKFLYEKGTDSICIKIIPADVNNITSYTVYIKFKKSPTIIDYDIIVYVGIDEDWKTCIPPNQMSGHAGVVYLGIHLPQNTDFERYAPSAKYAYDNTSEGDQCKLEMSNSWSHANHVMVGEKICSLAQMDYFFTVLTMGCLTWEAASKKWHPDKCELEWFPESRKIKCHCSNITDMVFGNSFVVAPNSIDFSAVFLKFSPLNQAAVMGTIGGLLLIYIVSIILLRKKDRRDALKWGITPLRDNIITDENYYIIKVYTGMRPGAGTKSRAAFVLSGEDEDTGPRELFDGVREEFSTGSTITLFMTTRFHLGELHHLHIWHDNSGEGDHASWYLNQVVVYDVECKKTYTFEAERWLSIGTGVNAMLSSRPAQDPILFETRFFNQAKIRLSEGHMWVSIMFRPELSTFTRVQRVSCALLYMFVNMIASAMFFNPDPNYELPALFEIGPFRFTPQQIFISIVCALVTMPPTMLLIFLFKRTKRQIRPIKIVHTPSNKHRCGCCCYCRIVCICQCRKKHKYRQSRKENYEKRLESKLLSPEEPDFNGSFYLPYWFVYIAWSIFFVGVVTCAFFIMLYSMEWGKQKSEKWLTTFFLSMLESLLFVDPIIVICTAFILALLIRTNKEDSNTDMSVIIENYKKLVGMDKVTLASGIHILRSVTLEYKEHKSLPRNVTLPLSGADLQHAAEEHKHKSQLKALAWDLLYNIFFILIVASICFANRSSNSYLHYEETINTVVEPASMLKFSQIKTPGDFFEWVNATALPALMPEHDITGQPIHWTEKQFVKGSSSLRLGPPRLRQLRMSQGYCTIPHIGRVECVNTYSMISEETQSYCTGWHQGPCGNLDNLNHKSALAWKFTSALDIWGLPVPGSYATYGGGGYIAEFDVNYAISVDVLNELFDNLWIDRQTMAVFFEYTLYNVYTSTFIHNHFMVEFPETGGAFLAFQTYPLRLYQHLGPMGTYTLACEVIFVVCLFVLFVKICIRIYQQRSQYFKQFWRVYDMAMLALGISICIVYALRLIFSTFTIDNYMEDKYAYVNFAHIVLWDQILVTLLGCLAFMATMHMLESFGTSNRVKAFVTVFEICGKDLFWYGVMFVHMLFGFCFLGVLLFGAKLESYMNIYECLGTLFISMIGKSKFAEINETDPILAKLYFVTYITVTVFFVMTMFLSILCGTIDEVVKDIRNDPRPDLVDMMMKAFKDLMPGNKSHVKPHFVKQWDEKQNRN